MRLLVFTVLVAVSSSCVPHRGEAPQAAVAAVGGQVDTAQARVIVEAAAEDLDVDLRGIALAYLVALAPQPGGGPFGPRGVWDPSPWVQRAVLDVLARRLHEPESRALLLGVAQRPGLDPYVRGAAAVRLARDGDRTALAAMQAAYQAATEPSEVAPFALAAAMMGDGAAVGALQAALREGELPLDLPFFRDLGASGVPDLHDALVETLGLVEEPAQLPVAAALLSLGSKKGEATFALALAEPEGERPLEALDFLSDVATEPATALLRKASREGDETVRLYARLALAERGEGDPRVLEEALASPDPDARAMAARFAGRTALAHPGERAWDRAVARVLGAALVDPVDAVRREAVKAAVAAHRTEQAALLESLLAAEWEDLKVEAAGAMLALGGGAS